MRNILLTLKPVIVFVKNLRFGKKYAAETKSTISLGIIKESWFTQGVNAIVMVKIEIHNKSKFVSLAFLFITIPIIR